jgi:hypothetical protein
MAEKIDINKIIDLAGIRQGFAELDQLLKDTAGNVVKFEKLLDDSKKGAAQSAKVLTDQLADLKAQLDKQAPSSKQGQKNIDDLGDSIASTGKKIETARKDVENFDKSSEAMTGSLADVTKRLKEAKKEFEQISQEADPEKFAQVAQKTRLLAAEQKRLRDQLKATNRSLGGINENLKFQEGSYNQVRAEVKKYKTALGDLKVGSDEYRKTEAKLNDALEREIAIREKQPSLFAKRIRQAQGESKEVKELTTKLRGLRKELANTDDIKVFDKISKEIKHFGGIVAGGAAGIASKGLELVVEGLSSVAAEIKEITPQLRDLEVLSGLSGDALIDLTGAARATSKTFGVEFNQVAESANALTKELGGTFAENVALINEALVFDPEGESLQFFREYSAQLSNLGVTSEEAVKIAQIQRKEGFFDDKLFDTIKEGALRLGDLSTAQKDVLKTLGPIGQEIQDTFAAGDKLGAIQLTAEAINELGEQGKNVQPIISNLFGGPGEDLGARGFEVLANLRGINIEMTDLQKQQLALVESRTELETSLTELASELSGSGNAFEMFFNKLKTFGVDLLVDVAQFFNEIGGELKKIFKFFGAGNSVIGDLISKMVSFVPVVTLIKAQFQLLGGYVRGLIGAYKRLIAFGAALNKSLGDPLTKIVQGISDLWSTLTDSVGGFETSMTDSFKAFKDSAKDAVTFVVKKVFEAVEFLRQKFDFISALIPDDFEKKARAKFAGFKAEFDKVLAELNAEDPPEIEPELAPETEKNLNAKIQGLKIDPIKVKIEPEFDLGALEEIKNKTKLGVEEASRASDDVAQLQKENANRVQANQEVIDLRNAAAEQARLDKQKKNEETAAQFANALGSKFEEKLAERTNRRFDKQRARLEEQGASQAALDALEEKRQKRLARQQILSATLRASIEGFIASLKAGNPVGKALADGGSAGAIAGGLASIAAFEKGGLVEGGEQIVRINEKGEEYVINAEATRKHLPTLEAINSGKDLIPIMGTNVQRLERTQATTVQANVIDYNEIGKAVAKYSQKTRIEDEAGRIILSDETASSVKKIIIERASVLPKFGK